MRLPENCIRLKVYIGEDDHYKGKPLFEYIVKKAREMNLAGVTVLRGIMGYGANSRIHTFKLLSLSEDLPIIIEIIDCKERIDKFLPILDEIITDGLVTLEDVKIYKYIHNKKDLKT